MRRTLTIIAFAGIAASGLLLVCSPTANEVAAASPKIPGSFTELWSSQWGLEVRQWTDPTSGCRYIITQTGAMQGGVAITPALNAAGQPDCMGPRP